MPYFIAIHKWKKENTSTVLKKVIEVLKQLPEDICICHSYSKDLEAWCIYKAKTEDAGEQIKKLFEEHVPEMETEVKSVLQFYPPSEDLYSLIYDLVKS